jgi:hypothetical protein
MPTKNLTKKNSSKAQRRAAENAGLRRDVRKPAGRRGPATARRRRNKLPNGVAAVVSRHFSKNAGHYPDGQTFPCTPYNAVTRITLSSTGSGAAAVFLRPSLLQANHTTALGYSTGNFPITSIQSYGDVPDFTSLNASYSKYRVTGVHIAVEYIGAALTATGQVTVKQYMGFETATLFPPNFGDRSTIEDYFGVTGPLSICPLPVDLTFREFRHLSDAGGLTDNAPYPDVAIMATGVQASSSLFQVTMTQRVELIAEPTDFASRLASVHPDSALNTKALEVISMVGEKLRASGKTAIKARTQSVGEHVMRAIKVAGEGALGGYMSSRAGGGAASAGPSSWVTSIEEIGEDAGEGVLALL